VTPAAPAQVWIVAPSYRDAEAFRMLRDRLRRELHAVPTVATRPVHFVIVDDSAGLDPDAPGLADASDTTLLTVPFNLGHQRAIVYGLRRIMPAVADADVVVTLDSDGEDRPEDLPRLLAALLGDGQPLRRIVLAQRTHRRESLPFKVLYRTFRTIFRVATGTVITSGNYAAYRGWFVRHLLPHPFFDLCYSSSLLALGLDPAFVPCPRGVRYAGRSRMNLQRLIAHGFRMLMPFLDRIAIRALTAFSLVFAAACAGALAVVAARASGLITVPGWSTSTLLLAGLASLMAAGNAVVLFAVYTHSHGLFLRGLEALDDGRAGAAPDQPGGEAPEVLLAPPALASGERPPAPR
jgi:hypothetical protein